MCESYMFDHLRPLGVLSACDLLDIGHDLEWAWLIIRGYINIF